MAMKQSEILPEPQKTLGHKIPWWMIGVVLFLLLLVNQIVSNPLYNEAFQIIKAGLMTTIWVSLASFMLALAVGGLLITAVRSQSFFWRQIGLFLLTLAGSIPLLLLIYIVAFLFVPYMVKLADLNVNTFPMTYRFVLALVIFYSAFGAELFFIELGHYKLTNQEQFQAPAINLSSFSPLPTRRMILLLGIILVGILKDSAWMSLLAVGDIAHFTRLYSGSTFRMNEAYLAALVLYLLLTIPFKILIVNRYQANRAK